MYCIIVNKHINTCGCIKKKRIFSNDPKSRYYRLFTLIVFSGGELPVDKKCELTGISWVCKNLWWKIKKCYPVESSIWIMIMKHLSTWLALCNSFSVRLGQGVRAWARAGRGTWRRVLPGAASVYAQRQCFVQFLTPENSPCTSSIPEFWPCLIICIWLYMYEHRYRVFYSYRFLGRQRIGNVKVQAKLKWNAWGYYTIPHWHKYWGF